MCSPAGTPLSRKAPRLSESAWSSVPLILIVTPESGALSSAMNTLPTSTPEGSWPEAS
jgi:hypothetical protein